MPRGISTDNRKGENKMKRNTMLAILALATAFVCSAEDDNSDEKIKRLIVGSNFYIDNPDASYRMFMNARRRCGTDTNRFARLLAEVAQTNNNWVAQDAISSLGVYGTSAQLPFLYSMATNEQHGATAVKSILRLEGVTSNSVDVTGMYLSMTNIIQRDRSEICSFFFNAVKTSDVSAALKERGECVALRYAGTANLYFRRMDEAMISTEPAYRLSKRRLAVLRSAYELGVSQYQIAYVTNAINELVAYPEADLPE